MLGNHRKAEWDKSSGPLGGRAEYFGREHWHCAWRGVQQSGAGGGGVLQNHDCIGHQLPANLELKLAASLAGVGVGFLPTPTLAN